MMTLDPQLMTDLSQAPRHKQAEVLLSGPESPLPDAVRFSHGVAGLAYMAFLAYTHGRRKGVLGGKPGYEAVEILGSRMRSAATRAGSLDEWAHELLGSLRVEITELRMDDRLWWRGFLALHDGIQTRRLLQRATLAEVGTASELLRDWIYQIRDHAKAAEADAT